MRIEKSTGRIFYDFSMWNNIDGTITGNDNPTLNTLENGIQLLSNTQDCRLDIPEIPYVHNMSTIMDVTVPNNGQIGVTLSDITWSKYNGSFGIVIALSVDSLMIGYGSNSNNSRTIYVLANVTGTFSGRHIIKVESLTGTHKVYIDGELKATAKLNSADYITYCRPHLRTYGDSGTGIFHSLEVLSSDIMDPKIFDITRRIAIHFDSEINSYSLLSNLSAFKIYSKQYEFMNTLQEYEKECSPIDIMYGISNGEIRKDVLILTIAVSEAFVSPTQLKVLYDSARGDLYGKRTIDKMENWEYQCEIIPTKLQPPGYRYFDEFITTQVKAYKNPEALVINKQEQPYVETMSYKGTNISKITITLVGEIKP